MKIKKSAWKKIEYLCIFGYNSVICRVTKMIFIYPYRAKKDKDFDVNNMPLLSSKANAIGFQRIFPLILAHPVAILATRSSS